MAAASADGVVDQKNLILFITTLPRRASRSVLLKSGAAKLVRRSLLPSKPALNISKNKFQFVKNQDVLESYNLNSNAVEECRTLAVVCPGHSAAVNLPVQLYREPFFNAVKVQYVLSHAVLSSKLPARKPRLFQFVPQSGFGWSQTLTELFPPRLYGLPRV